MPSAQARDLIAYRALDRDLPALPHLIIVIDEFRMLVDEAPRALSELMRIAAIGRSLGIHLIMATQRPQGAITADIRANVTSRVVLRVQSGMESMDVMNSPLAADIPIATPGRAFLVKGTEAPQEFQTATLTPDPPPPAGRTVTVLTAAERLSRPPAEGRAEAGRRPRDPGPGGGSARRGHLPAVDGERRHPAAPPGRGDAPGPAAVSVRGFRPGPPPAGPAPVSAGRPAPATGTRHCPAGVAGHAGTAAARRAVLAPGGSRPPRACRRSSGHGSGRQVGTRPWRWWWTSCWPRSTNRTSTSSMPPVHSAGPPPHPGSGPWPGPTNCGAR